MTPAAGQVEIGQRVEGSTLGGRGRAAVGREEGWTARPVGETRQGLRRLPELERCRQTSGKLLADHTVTRHGQHAELTG
jgi:hypothetical protein